MPSGQASDQHSIVGWANGEVARLETSLIEKESSTHHAIAMLPIGIQRCTIPVLFTEDRDGDVAVDVEALEWVRSRPMERLRTLRANVGALGRLHDYHQQVWEGVDLSAADRRSLIHSYLDARLHGCVLGSSLPGLSWHPVGLGLVRTEFRAFTDFYRFKADPKRDSMHQSQSQEIASGLAKSMHEDARRKDRDLLSHLRASRIRWAALFDPELRMPDLKVREIARSGNTFSLDRTIAEADLRAIIREEPSPAYRAMWILAGYAGLRTSMMLHMWQCDVLPAGTHTHLGGEERLHTIVVVAHPARSTFLGDFTRKRDTRLAFLRQRYGLLPRHLVDGHRFVGWKNPLMTDPNLQISIAEWRDNDLPVVFDDCLEEIRAFHKRHSSSDRHPYLFVNMSDGPGMGMPIAQNKVRAAFVRACKRVGLEAAVNGRRPHGLRHRYKAALEALGLDRRQIQILMLHNSEDSQDDYGRDSVEVRRQLSQALQRTV